MADLDAHKRFFFPAFAETDRSTFMGNRFVGEPLLAENPMRMTR
ncbi:hypothetical protein CLV78_102525 [Aliiruegeria haliotis]|uniref:Uncharacterized protein n=1 Tax=Aliiruegeria haliotis TaxID=1280846 RepID=A0A2T0RW20_9RHOB|nr:hypothetical protein [Aliiruegeria haliotis]PRY25347.1 hypothetical protein CLV78_102525 [Aliiruegeria haliotis]